MIFGFGSPKVPSWASFFKHKDYQAFIEAVRKRTAPFGYDVTRLEDGFLDRESHQYGLLNLAQTCHASPSHEWTRIIDNWFDRMERQVQAAKDLTENKKDFEKVRDLLCVRLWPEDFLRDTGGKEPRELKCVYRQDLAGTLTVLFYNLPEALAGVGPEDLELWGKSRDELFDLALKNTHALAKAQENIIEIPVGSLVVLLGDELFTATEALWLGEHPRCVGKHGALVAVPAAAMVMTYPIQDIEVAKVLQYFIPLVQKRMQAGPNSISPNLFWFHDGTFTLLPLKPERGKLAFHPPAAFVELLERLAQEK